jgi:signal peptidase I
MKARGRKTVKAEGEREGPLRQVLTLVVAAVVALAARSSLADHYVVPSGSMLPTVHEGDRILVNKLAYGLRLPFTEIYVVETADPEPGQVVVLRSPEGGTVLLKRVVAGPGDTIEVVDGHLVLNGQPVPILDEAGHLTEQLSGADHPVLLTDGGGPGYGPLTLPADRFLVLGDNRGDSRDGRFFGLVDRGAILGRALGCFSRGGDLSWRPL